MDDTRTDLDYLVGVTITKVDEHDNLYFQKDGKEWIVQGGGWDGQGIYFYETYESRKKQA